MVCAHVLVLVPLIENLKAKFILLYIKPNNKDFLDFNITFMTNGAVLRAGAQS